MTLWDRFDAFANTVKPDHSSMDMLFDIMLKIGYIARIVQQHTMQNARGNTSKY